MSFFLLIFALSVPFWVIGAATGLIADHRAHGGPDQAVLAYPAAHYPLWRAEWGRDELAHGGFGENLRVDGADEETVCIGDRWAIGDTVLEVSKPRSPCNRLAWYQRPEDLIQRARGTGMSGWYLRVVGEGTLQAAPRSRGSSDRIRDSQCGGRRAMARRHENRDEAMLLVRCAALAGDWRLRWAREEFRREGDGGDRSAELRVVAKSSTLNWISTYAGE